MCDSKKCIFCLNSIKELGEKNPFTIEHIIPKALGNSEIKLDCVCKNCNSKLGENIDAYFCNNTVVQLFRQKLSLISYSGKIPNSFAKGKTEDGLTIITDNKFRRKIQPRIVESEDHRHIIIDASSKEEAKSITLKKLSRLSISQEQIDKTLSEIDNTIPKKINPVIKYELKMEINRLKLEALKIAYELAIYVLGIKYLNDVEAEKIRIILKKAIDGEYKKDCPDFDFVFYGLNCKESFSFLNSLENKVHFFLIFKEQKSINVFISLFASQTFSFFIKVSDNADKYDINDTPIIIQL